MCVCVCVQVDLVVGNSVADLMSPRELGGALVELCGDAGALLYLPSTFAGGTALSPADAADDGCGSPGPGSTDTERETGLGEGEVLGCYHNHLQSVGKTVSWDGRKTSVSDVLCSYGSVTRVCAGQYLSVPTLVETLR